MIDKKEIGKNLVFGHWMYYLKNGGGIHGKIKNWKPGDDHREPAFAPIFEQEVETSESVFDIGANLGYYALMAARHGCRVFAIEPDPRNVELLDRAVERNGYGDLIDVHPMAISDKFGPLDFHLADATNLSSMQKTQHATEKIKVPAMSLSMFHSRLRAKKQVGFGHTFIRMDIEGHEVEALKGMYSLFRHPFPCKIFMEVHPQFYSEEHSLEAVLKKILSFGFTTKYVISAGVPHPRMFTDMGYEPRIVYDCGRFARGVYDDFLDRDMLKVTCHQHREYFDDRMRARSGEEYTDKIVRAVLLERG